MSKASLKVEPAFDHIRDEGPGESLAIDQLLELTFGGRDEANLVAALREGGFNLLSLVAERQSQVVGHVLFTRLPIVGDHQTWSAIALAPLAVHPASHGQGIGTALLRTGLARLYERGETIVVVLGHESYYARFGFSATSAIPLKSSFSGPHWMALELTPGALQGVEGRVQYAPPFGC
jgi:putative acetyltransferase